MWRRGRFWALRASSVFPAPIRPVLGAGSWEVACSMREASEGKRMAKQAWAIVPKILEIDRLQQAGAASAIIVRKVHPEICFWAWAGLPMEMARQEIDWRCCPVGRT